MGDVFEVMRDLDRRSENASHNGELILLSSKCISGSVSIKATGSLLPG